MLGELSHERIEELISNQFIGRIGCHANGATYVVPVSYAYDDPYIYGRTFDGMKIEMMRKNPKVCFEVDNIKNLANWQSVIAWGEFEELKEDKERKNGLQKLYERALPMISSDTMHITPQWPFPSKEINEIDGIIYRIRLTEKTGRFEKSKDEFFYAS